MEICADCGKPILTGQPSYYAKSPGEDIGDTYHSGCGDPFGIKSAVAAERERCAKIAEGYARANHNLNTSPHEATIAIAVSKAIAATIRVVG